MKTSNWSCHLLSFVLVSGSIRNSSTTLHSHEVFRTEQIFWNSLTDDEVMSHVKNAESELKIYIYPIPPHAKFPEVDNCCLDEYQSHFQAE